MPLEQMELRGLQDMFSVGSVRGGTMQRGVASQVLGLLIRLPIHYSVSPSQRHVFWEPLPCPSFGRSRELVSATDRSPLAAAAAPCPCPHLQPPNHSLPLGGLQGKNDDIEREAAAAEALRGDDSSEHATVLEVHIISSAPRCTLPCCPAAPCRMSVQAALPYVVWPNGSASR